LTKNSKNISKPVLELKAAAEETVEGNLFFNIAAHRIFSPQSQVALQWAFVNHF
jgi:hypothetical protein